MERKELTLEEIHACTLEVLQKLISICDTLQINYFAMYGTLIGAVRHNGFIPWDDDLDVAMLRPEFDKFVQYCLVNQDALYPFRLMDVAVDPDYPFMIPRFCDMRYQMVYHEMPDLNMGVFIDIYPFDGVGKADPKEIQKLIRAKNRYITGMTYAVSKTFPGSQKGLIHKAIRYLYYRYSKKKGRDYYVNKIKKLCRSYSLASSTYIGCLAWNETIKPIHKAHFLDYEMLAFEQITIKSPKNYDTVLRTSYGDYMQLPPDSQRVPYHNYSIYKREK